jgi:flavin reductase (DIM6/NTAB) family NADH-FMN oxidoreductase RutF
MCVSGLRFEAHMFVNCSETNIKDLYKILIGAIVPRPIAWVSSRGQSGINNLAPFSFFNCFGVDPPMVGFSPAFKSIKNSDGEIIKLPKDTLRNITETKEFVVNIVSRNIAEKMNQTSADYPATISEFEGAGLTAVPSQLVRPPRVAESLVNLECKLIQVVHHGNNNLVLGEVVAIHLSDDVVTSSFHIKEDVLQAVGRMEGNWYTTTTDRFEMPRPGAPN